MVDVGALTERPRSEMFRIRRNVMRIQYILPLRATNGRPYILAGRLHVKLKFVPMKGT